MERPHCIDHVEVGRRWTFQHRRGNAHVETARYPEAAVADHKAFITELATNCGFARLPQARRGEEDKPSWARTSRS
jgi:hypothetical protein